MVRTEQKTQDLHRKGAEGVTERVNAIFETWDEMTAITNYESRGYGSTTILSDSELRDLLKKMKKRYPRLNVSIRARIRKAGAFRDIRQQDLTMSASRKPN
jgi:hypothetical protein